MKISCLVLLLSLGSVVAEEVGGYPEGDSSQVFEDVPFELRIPADLDRGEPLGMVLILPGSLSDLDSLQDQNFVIVAPQIPADRTSGLWSAGEIKVILKLIAHLRKSLSISPSRIHAVCVDKTSVHEIFEPLVFKKKAPFASATYVRSSLLRTSIPSSARKQMGVLAYEWTPGAQDGGGVQDFMERFDGKVRVAELRRSASPLDEDYFSYWLHVMGGGFEPGYDRSLPWTETAGGMDDIRKSLETRGTGGMLYFFSKTEDVSSKDARALQNEVFFDSALRSSARAAVCFKLPRESNAELFSSLGLERTPAVVVLDSMGAGVSTFQGKIKAKHLRKALKKAGS